MKAHHDTVCVCICVNVCVCIYTPICIHIHIQIHIIYLICDLAPDHIFIVKHLLCTRHRAMHLLKCLTRTKSRLLILILTTMS